MWERAVEDVLRWRVKTRSGFEVAADRAVTTGYRPVIRVRMAGLTVVEPVDVVDVVRERDRAGFAYRTLPGHPVDGEEAFIVQRTGDEVDLVVRSLTRAALTGRWRPVFPLLLVAQAVARGRYHRALRRA